MIDSGTARHFAGGMGNVVVVRVLTEEGGADKTARAANGQTALELANEKYRDDTPVEITTALR